MERIRMPSFSLGDSVAHMSFPLSYLARQLTRRVIVLAVKSAPLRSPSPPLFLLASVMTTARVLLRRGLLPGHRPSAAAATACSWRRPTPPCPNRPSPSASRPSRSTGGTPTAGVAADAGVRGRPQRVRPDGPRRPPSR